MFLFQPFHQPPAENTAPPAPVQKLLEQPPNKPPEDQVDRVKVLFDYTAQQPDELSIKVGEILEVVTKDVEEGWWEVGGVCVCVCVCGRGGGGGSVGV